MNLFKKTIAGAIFLGHFLLPSILHSEESKTEVSPFVLMTVPKSGSHLTIKALHFLTNGVSLWHTHFPAMYTVRPDEGFLYTHLCISPGLEEDYANLPKLKKIVNVRDLRDVCVSIVHQIRKAPWPGMTGEERAIFKQMPFEQQLFYVFNYEYELREIAKVAPNNLQVSVSKLAEQMLRLSLDPKNLVCRYENLVGPEGGGDAEAQIEELQRIAEYLNISVTRDYLISIASQLYGNSIDPFGKEGFEHFRSTFHKGQIGGWREMFTEEHKAIFKEKFGHVLIALGYEYDNNW
ncbi:MAG: sulfotransferase domain-containing protein [Chlamydiota bacterium]